MDRLLSENVGAESPRTRFDHDEARVILYALSVGADARRTDLTYERAEPALRVLPTFAAVPAVPFLEWTQRTLGASPASVILGEQTLEVPGPLRARGTLWSRATLKALYDKGKSALALTVVSTEDDAGRLVATSTFKIFVRGGGGFGGESGPRETRPVRPARAPDVACALETSANQAALYRLNGDLHPIHIDPAVARAEGLERPPLHGMCTLGFLGRAVIDAFCEGDPAGLRSISLRYAGTVYPGDTLRVSLWRSGAEVFVEAATQRGEAPVGVASAALGG